MQLGSLEKEILFSIERLRRQQGHDAAYSMNIRRDIEERLQHDYAYGAIHTTLTRMEKKQFVKSHMGGMAAKRGGRTKRLFQIGELGYQALREDRERLKREWQQIDDLLDHQ